MIIISRTTYSHFKFSKFLAHAAVERYAMVLSMEVMIEDDNFLVCEEVDVPVAEKIAFETKHAVFIRRHCAWGSSARHCLPLFQKKNKLFHTTFL